MRIDRRSLIAGGALLAIGAAAGPEQGIGATLDRAAALPPGERLAMLRRIDAAGLARGARLDLAAALRGAGLEADIAAATDAAERYPLQLRLNAGWDIAPVDAHAWGMLSAAALLPRIDGLLRQHRLRDGSIAERLRRLARDPRHLYPDSDAGKDRAVADMNRWLAKAKRGLATHFGIVPPSAYEAQVVRMTQAEDAASKTGYRTLPASGTAGAYHVDLHQIGLRPRWSLPSVVHHETLPGHLIQLPLQTAADPHPLRIKAAPGFVEGWAIYAEQLAAESGAFADDPLAEIGYLQWRLFRLGRLLIDTGINHHHWSRDRALAFVQDLQGDPMIFAPFEKDADRAIAEPGMLAGQALNALKIAEMRGRHTKGVALCAFHDRILRAGAVPIALLA